MTEGHTQQCDGNLDDWHSADEDFNQLVSAVIAAGGYVSPKLRRGPVKLSNHLGLFAAEAIEEGEELVRVPQELAICSVAFKAEMPHLYNAVMKCLEHTNDEQKAEMFAVTTCLVKLLGEAHASQACSSSAADSPLAGSTQKVWRHECNILLQLDFSDHPLFRVVKDVNLVQRLLAPSPELCKIIATVNDIAEHYENISTALGSDALSHDLNHKLFWQAFTSYHTRTFKKPVIEGEQETSLCVLIPIIDLFNHSEDAGCEVVPASTQETAGTALCDMVIADRAHSPGEEMTICYKCLSNSKLFRVHGFTLPPEIEPTCTFSIQMDRDEVRLVREKFLPQGFEKLSLDLNIHVLDESVVEALQACHESGHDARKFLAELCLKCREPYERDPLLQPALAALTRLRLQVPNSGAWWTCMPGTSTKITGLSKAPEYNGTVAEIICWEPESGKCRVRLHTGKQARLLPENLTTDEESAGDDDDPWKIHSVRLKMSEYLCLSAHIEAAQVALGQLKEAMCIETNLGAFLTNALEALGSEPVS